MESIIEKPSRGRPRAFDREQALQKALSLFWAHGYEGTSLSELLAVMEIAPPSLYAAFGSKEALYLEAIELYLRGPGSFFACAMQEESNTLAFIRRVLTEAAKEFTSSSHPPGCIIISGLMNCAAAHQKIAEHLANLRMALIEAIEQRLGQGVAEGALPSGANCQQIARFYGSVIQGMSIQARDGASTDELLAVAELALKCWPQPPATENAG